MHSMNYLLYRCTSVNVWLPLSSKKDASVQKRFLVSLENKILLVLASFLPGLWSITQIVVETAALRRTGVHGGDKFTCGCVEPQEQEKEHFGQLLRIRNLPTCARFAHTKSEKKITHPVFHLHYFRPHGFLPPLRCPIVIALLWVPR